MLIQVGQKLGPYLLEAEVGAGGLGKVFRGVDERSGQTVAIKILHEKYTSSRKFIGIFHRELLIVSRLRHKHIVSYLDNHFGPPVSYIVTQFVDGWSVYAFLKKVGPVPPLVALSIVIDMLQGIDYLHLHDTIHSDLSAPNVLVDVNGRVFVTDFGLACQLDVEDYKNYMVGTPGYYSPEHVTESSIVPQTDIYCAGLILFELITGTKAVVADQSRRKVLKGMKSIPLKNIVCADRNMTNKLRKLIGKALQFNPQKRFTGADAMMFDCYSILKAYNIRYARHAIRKYLLDRGLVRGTFEGRDQDIYRGLAS